MIVRAYESSGRPAHARIDLPLLGRTIEADFGPAEIKTFRVPRDPAAPAHETDLLEWPAAPEAERTSDAEREPAPETG